MISRKGVTPVEWCKCNQYEIALKPRRVPVISTTISPFLQINKKTTILNTPPILLFQTFPSSSLYLRWASLVCEATTPKAQERSTWTTLLASKFLLG